ncbi:hypothetical protein P3T37_004904 [Kitasatospora sp. MAA4]|nr:hypothetical protein [Kitasatospora sp. MAA4]MDH6135488.1 hypothetical protein [Kitasatospora sp. MAA4]
MHSSRRQAWNAFWRDPARTPSVLMAIRLADPGWLEGPAVGDGWDSPAYE